MKTLSFDIETFSKVDLSKAGVYRYAFDSSFEILLFACSVDGGEVFVFDIANGDTIPDEILSALSDAGIIKRAFNAAFERVCMSAYLAKTRGITEMLPPAGWYCTQVAASYNALPRSLAGAGKALGVNKEKLATGTALINLFSKPQKPTKMRPDTRRTKATDPEKWEEFVAYCKRDVETEQEIWSTLEQEQEIPFKVWRDYWLSEQINDTGVLIDTDMAKNAVKVLNYYTVKIQEQLKKVTGLDNPNSVQQLMGWVREQGVDIPSLNKADIEAILPTLDKKSDVYKVLALRVSGNFAAGKKYGAALAAQGSDERVRGMFGYYGAHTGRFTSKIVQLQNLKKSHLTVDEMDDYRSDLCEGKIVSPDELSQLVRTMIIPNPGKVFAVCDFSAIEARVLAWLAGEQWVLDVFSTHGKIYEAQAARMYKCEIDQVTKDMRQKGKVAILAGGYQGGVAAYERMGALQMGLRADELPALVQQYRQSNRNIVKFWYDLESRAKAAICGEPSFNVGRGLSFRFANGNLYIKLPSGRELCYREAKVSDGSITHAVEVGASWARHDTYGGVLANNCIAKGTLVVTNKGFVPIELITTEHKVWDGEDFVTHNGVVAKGAHEVINLDGVCMTPDHKVLTKKGWKDGSTAFEFGRPKVKLPRSKDLCWCAKKAQLFRLPMYLWKHSNTPRRRVNESTKTREHTILRMQTRGEVEATKPADTPPIVSPLEGCKVPLPVGDFSCVQQLWWPRNKILRKVERLLAFCGRYVPLICTWVNARQDRCQRRLRTLKLSLGYYEGAGEEQERQQDNNNALGGYDRSRSFREERYWADDIALPTSPQCTGVTSVHRAKSNQQVYDLLDCGANRRFCVIGATAPMLVHNCTQGLARDLLTEAIKRLGNKYGTTVAHVHDEVIIEVEPGADVETICQEMSIVPTWAKGLPMKAEGYLCNYYRKE